MKMYLYSTANIFFYHEHEKIDKENFKKAIFNQFDVCPHESLFKKDKKIVFIALLLSVF